MLKHKHEIKEELKQANERIKQLEKEKADLDEFLEIELGEAIDLEKNCQIESNKKYHEHRATAFEEVIEFITNPIKK